MRVLCFILIILTLPILAMAENRDQNRRTHVYGTGNFNTGGSVTTYTDPQTGDIVTSVVPPKNNDPYAGQHNSQSFPIYIYPEVTPQGQHRPKPHNQNLHEQGSSILDKYMFASNTSNRFQAEMSDRYKANPNASDRYKADPKKSNKYMEDSNKNERRKSDKRRHDSNKDDERRKSDKRRHDS